MPERLSEGVWCLKVGPVDRMVSRLIVSLTEWLVRWLIG